MTGGYTALLRKQTWWIGRAAHPAGGPLGADRKLVERYRDRWR
jgi:hypothetical protein